MTEQISKSRTRWNDTEVEELKRMVAENTPTRVIGMKLGRTPKAVRSKCLQMGIPLKPGNRPPFV